MKQDGSTGQVVFMGSIGDGKNGKALVEALNKCGVKEVMHREHDARTGACAVVVVGKERTLCASLAACQKYPTSHLVENWVRNLFLNF
jgi:adenosine kinase